MDFKSKDKDHSKFFIWNFAIDQTALKLIQKGVNRDFNIKNIINILKEILPSIKTILEILENWF